MNNELFFFLHSFANQNYLVDKIIIFFAQIFPWVISISVIIFLIYLRKIGIKNNKEEKKKIISEYILFIVSSLSAVFLSYLIKIVTNIPRPYIYFDLIPLIEYGGYDSFPSLHTLFFSVIAFSLFSYNKKIGLFLIFSTFLVGIARVISGLHFPIDIIGGFLLGFFIVYGTKKFIADSLIIK